MSSEANKALVLQACQYLNDINLPALFDLIHEDGSWSIPYDPASFAFGGYKDKAAVSATLTQFLGTFSTFEYLVDSIVADGDRVSIEAHSHGVGPGGAKYSNVYCKTFLIKDGKLHTVREFFDPFRVLSYVAQLSG